MLLFLLYIVSSAQVIGISYDTAKNKLLCVIVLVRVQLIFSMAVGMGLFWIRADSSVDPVEMF